MICKHSESNLLYQRSSRHERLSSAYFWFLKREVSNIGEVGYVDAHEEKCHDPCDSSCSHRRTLILLGFLSLGNPRARGSLDTLASLRRSNFARSYSFHLRIGYEDIKEKEPPGLIHSLDCGCAFVI